MQIILLIMYMKYQYSSITNRVTLMKLALSFFLLSCLPLGSNAQTIVGDWNGTLKVPAAEIPLVLHVSKIGEKLSSSLDSPSQGATNIPVGETNLKDSIVSFSVGVIGATYLGKWTGDVISGNFSQNGQTFPLTLIRGVAKPFGRPQDPKEPFPYHSEQIVFENTKATLRLSGTFTNPNGTKKFPAVVLISGSGPQNRNEELAGHRPFLVLSDYLTRNGIAVLRFDDRGTGASTGNFATATTSDFATDVEAAVRYLKTRPDVDVSKIGLIGHSEGGLIAPMVASNSGDVAFIVLLAGPGVKGEQILTMQSKLIGKANGSPDEDLNRAALVNQRIFSAIKETSDIPALKAQLVTIILDGIQSLPEVQRPPLDQRENIINQQVNSLATPWMRYFLSYDPTVTLTKVRCPVLALNGSNDLQVPATENLEAIRSSLQKGGNTDVTTKSLSGLNHLFQESVTGSPSEYSSIQQTFSPVALEEICKWVISKTK